MLRRIIFVQVHYCATVILSILKYLYLNIDEILSKKEKKKEKKLTNKRFIVLEIKRFLLYYQ